MLRFRKHVLSAVRTLWLLPAAASLHRLPLSTATASLAPFVAEDYLVTTCGLKQARAPKSSKCFAHVKSSNADAVLAFLASAGVVRADVAAAIAKDPRFLCSKVDKTLNPHLGMLRGIGLSSAQISSLISIVPNILRNPGMINRLEFLLSFLGSFEKVHTTLNRSDYILGRDFERVVKPNISFLRHCGITDCDIVKILLLSPRTVVLKLECIEEIVACVDRLGVPRNSAMFKHGLMTVHCITPGGINARWNLLKKALGCSEDELSIAVRKWPNVLNFTKDKLSCLVEFLKMEVGLNVEYILRRPALLRYSLKRRLMPRRYVLNVLKEKGLLKKDMDFYSVVSLSEKKFAKRFLDPYKEGVHGLAAAYEEQVTS